MYHLALIPMIVDCVHHEGDGDHSIPAVCDALRQHPRAISEAALRYVGICCEENGAYEETTAALATIWQRLGWC